MAITKGVADSKGGMRHLVAPATAAAQMKNVKGAGTIKIKISKILNKNWLLVKCKLMGTRISQAGRLAGSQRGLVAAACGTNSGNGIWCCVAASLIGSGLHTKALQSLAGRKSLRFSIMR